MTSFPQSAYARDLVSVVLPTRNRAVMLQRAVSSVLSQSWRDLELLVVSDGSTDGTDDMMRGQSDSRVRYFRHDRVKGASAARNTAIAEASGRYIAFLDDDDEWLPDSLESRMTKMVASPSTVGIVYGWMEYFRDGKVVDKREPVLRGNVFADLLDRQALSGCPSLLVRREAVLAVGGFDESLLRGNDGDFIRRISEHYEVDFVPHVVCRVHLGHTDRISRDTRENLRAATTAIEKRLAIFQDAFDKHPDKKARVLGELVTACLWSGRYSEAVQHLRSLISCPVGSIEKTRIILNSARSSSGRLFRQAIPSLLRRSKMGPRS